MDMIGERTYEGWTVRLKPRGVMRYFTAAFLIFWLCGWLAGECFALWVLGNGLIALMSGTPLGPGKTPLQPGPALAMGGFLLFWLALWTLGGIAAMSELFRMLWGEDRLSAGASGLTLQTFRGPFRRRREFARDAIRRLILNPTSNALSLETARGTVELSRLGTAEERKGALEGLRRELGIAEMAGEAQTESLPKGWEEIITPEGERAVVPDRSIRRAQSRVAFAAAFGLGLVALAVMREATRRMEILPFAILLGLASIAMGCGALWLARGRMEWRIGSGSLTLRRRYGGSARDVFEARRLELVITPASEGSDSITLEASSEATPAPRDGIVTHKSFKNRRRIASVVRDPSLPRRLGLYLSRVSHVPFEDRTTPEAREAEFAVLRERLEKSGKLGRFAVKLVVDLQKRNRAS